MLNNNDFLYDLQDDSTVVATVIIILLEFSDQDGNLWYLEGDVIVEEVEYAALVPAEPEEIKFKKWIKARHLKPLYIKAHVNEKPISRVLIDGGVVLNMMPYNKVKKLGKSLKDLKETNITMSNFTGGSTPALDFLITELTVEPKITNTIFFMVDAKSGYTILLGREWIHANQCVLSTFHQ